MLSNKSQVPVWLHDALCKQTHFDDIANIEHCI